MSETDDIMICVASFHGKEVRFYTDPTLPLDNFMATTQVMVSSDEAPMECDIAVLLAARAVQRIRDLDDDALWDAFIEALELLGHQLIHEQILHEHNEGV